VCETLRDFKGSWDVLSLHERGRLLRVLIERATATESIHDLDVRLLGLEEAATALAEPLPERSAA